MPNFAPIVFLDTFELVASLRRQIGLFDHETPRVLAVRRPRRNTEEDDEDFTWDPVAQKWTELKNFLGRTKRAAERLLGPQELGHIYLEMLDPGARLPWVGGMTGSYVERHTRLVLALRTNPLAMMYAGTETFSPAPGWLTAVNVQVPHSAINLGEWPRVHLVLDCRKKEPAIEEGS